MRKSVAVIISLLPLMGCSAASNERNDRIYAEWAKFEKQATNVCFDGGVVHLNYSVLDLQDGQPITMTPAVPADIMTRISNWSSLDEAAAKVIAGPVNDAVASRIDKLRDGTYNTIFVTLQGKARFAITPGKDESTELLLWIPRSGVDVVLDQLGGETWEDEVFVISSDGVMSPLEEADMPSWMRSKRLTDHIVSDYRSERQRQKNYTKCE